MEATVNKIQENLDNNLTEEHTKEGISAAYVKAIANYAGFNFEQPVNDYGIDGTFSGIKVRKKGGEKRLLSDGCKLDFQLKASINVKMEKDLIKYSLESKNYNDLVDDEICTPRILIVYKLPRNKDEWIKVTENGTMFKDCAWWCYLSGLQETNNKETITIEIPRNQIFDDKSLKELMGKVKKGEIV
ncbi:hypothetical protein CBE01nite_29750 [Clostridium beijerinckii]|uniref:DUF4365 domain-containing protein n=1 Tax=Clostridium beijerinckii TaxID=1520 RepID=A0AB74VD89_CLOBE|nr:DUF4365 domain-containing protein [Clostridium beijerinckii]NRZ28755.1 hypothetical protein [Clostridium beijerinckii]NYB95469.1 hypothetical protein [Clostridium beijerinckii]OOM24584.1 hypothetical protein CLBEI_20450 [Clostridium beijerinckii]QUN34433.1 DUF4365 domain-containing protein [Clostridium beijerinckii]SQB00613.1 Uncharacterised protein [Clostridium beijerinckii]